MTAIASKPITTRNSSLRSILLGGLIIGIVHAIIHHWIFVSLIEGNPLISVYQYLASGVLGIAAFEGGMPAALLGVFFHFLVSFVVAAVFVLSAQRIALLRRYPIPSAIVYGLGVLLVMNAIVLRLSAAPVLPPPTTPQLIELVLEHCLVIGLTLGILVQRSANPHS